MTEAWGATPVPVREGDVLAGKFRIERILGVGGMGVVVQAHHLQLDERVAIKFLLPQALGDADVVARFTREARTAIKIKSEHVARVIDVGTLETGAPYMVMEYLEGVDLGAWIRSRGTLSTEVAAEFVLHACEALAEAHALGIVHRDLKPANLFVVRRADGLYAIRVLDFGISKARVSDASLGGLTSATAVMGSPSYMSPEQLVSSKDVDARSDIWALGVTLYEAMTAQLPFDADSMTAVCMKVVQAEPPSLRAIRPDVPEAFEAVILRCLQKQRENRYANVAELAYALAPFGPKRARGSVERIARTVGATLPSGSGESIRAPTVVNSLDGASPGAATSVAWGQSQSFSSSSKRALLVSGGIAVTLILVGVGVVALRGSSSSTSGAAPGSSGAVAAQTASGAVAVPIAPPTGAPAIGVQPAGDAPAHATGAEPAALNPNPGTEPVASATAAAEAVGSEPSTAGKKGHAALGRPASGSTPGSTPGSAPHPARHKGPAVDTLIDDRR